MTFTSFFSLLVVFPIGAENGCSMLSAGFQELRLPKMGFAQRRLLSSTERLTWELCIGKLRILLSHLLISKVSDQLIRV